MQETLFDDFDKEDKKDEKKVEAKKQFKYNSIKLWAMHYFLTLLFKAFTPIKCILISNHLDIPQS